MTVAAEIRAELGRQRIKYADLSRRLGMSGQRIWALLTDDNRPLRDIEIKEIADELGVPASESMRPKIRSTNLPRKDPGFIHVE